MNPITELFHKWNSPQNRTATRPQRKKVTNLPCISLLGCGKLRSWYQQAEFPENFEDISGKGLQAVPLGYMIRGALVSRTWETMLLSSPRTSLVLVHPKPTGSSLERPVRTNRLGRGNLQQIEQLDSY